MSFEEEYYHPLEPNVTEEYLRDYQSFIAPLVNIVQTLPDRNTPVEIATPALETTPYKLIAYTKSGYGEIHLHLRVVNQDNSNINGGQAGMNLFYNAGNKTVTGNAFNHTRPENRPIRQSPIRNVSGILAPLEDAFCQALADTRKETVTRDFITERPIFSRFVQNYLSRGYKRVESRKGTVRLKRVFTPVFR